MAVGVSDSVVSTPKPHHVSSPKLNDVFLSFRGEDTRRSFVSYLYYELCRKKIETYKDDEVLKTGDEISPSLRKAIEDSKLSVVIFSKNYASSTWCLEELVHIVQCHKNTRHWIIPIFYEVDPSHVRKQEGSYAEAFVQLGKRFNNRMDKVRDWRDALISATSLKGWNSRDYRNDCELVESVVNDVVRKVDRILPISDFLKNMVGIQERVKAIKPLLCNGVRHLRIIGFWGANGVGKTTLADALLRELSSQFQTCFFLENVREESKNHGYSALKLRLFAGLLEEENPYPVGNSGQFPSSIVRQRLRKTNVIVVLDDVSSPEQFHEILSTNSIQFGDESRIIVTTRDLQVLRSIGAHEIHRVEELNEEEALQLFRLNAFDKGICPEDYIELSEKAVKNYVKGNPLVLKLLGYYLCSKSNIEWKKDLRNLKMTSFPEIQRRLRRSYDDLDPKGKEIFLDIACFFNGEKRDIVESLLDGSSSNCASHRGIDDLINKSVISTIGEDNRLYMDYLTQEFARHEESRKDFERRSRLWNAEDISEVLQNNTGTRGVNGIFLDVTTMKDRLFLSYSVFSNMSNLRFLKIYNSGSARECKVDVSEQGLQSCFTTKEGLGSLPKSLVYVHWHGYPLKCLPSNFTPENLVEFSMPYSQVEKLWNGKQNLGKLKRINLSYSERLIRLPDLSTASELESINLECCASLIQVPELQNLDKLASLNVNGCKALRNLPVLPRNLKYLSKNNCPRLTSVSGLESHFNHDLCGCSWLKNFTRNFNCS